MHRAEILSQIRRLAELNGGVPLGRQRFERETGVREADWLGRYWTRWNNALAEAGWFQLSRSDIAAFKRRSYM